MGDFKESKQTMKTVRPSQAGREREVTIPIIIIFRKKPFLIAHFRNLQGGGEVSFLKLFEKIEVEP